MKLLCHYMENICLHPRCNYNVFDTTKYCRSHKKYGLIEEAKLIDQKPCLLCFEPANNIPLSSSQNFCKSCLDDVEQEISSNWIDKDDYSKLSSTYQQDYKQCNSCSEYFKLNVFRGNTSRLTLRCRKCRLVDIVADNLRRNRQRKDNRDPEVRKNWKDANKDKKYYQTHRAKNLLDNPEEYRKINSENMKKYRNSKKEKDIDEETNEYDKKVEVITSQVKPNIRERIRDNIIKKNDRKMGAYINACKRLNIPITGEKLQEFCEKDTSIHINIENDTELLEKLVDEKIHSKRESDRKAKQLEVLKLGSDVVKEKRTIAKFKHKENQIDKYGIDTVRELQRTRRQEQREREIEDKGIDVIREKRNEAQRIRRQHKRDENIDQNTSIFKNNKLKKYKNVATVDLPKGNGSEKVDIYVKDGHKTVFKINVLTGKETEIRGKTQLDFLRTKKIIDF